MDNAAGLGRERKHSLEISLLFLPRPLCSGDKRRSVQFVVFVCEFVVPFAQFTGCSFPRRQSCCSLPPLFHSLLCIQRLGVHESNQTALSLSLSTAATETCPGRGLDQRVLDRVDHDSLAGNRACWGDLKRESFVPAFGFLSSSE